MLLLIIMKMVPGCYQDIETDNSYRVVLLDINMEPMDGFQIAEQIAKSNSKILIVFVTSHEETVYDSFDYMPFYFTQKVTI